MANDHNIKTFTAIDIEKYHKGLLSPGERHLLEKAALDDPFLADALEGYATPGVNVSADIDELKRRLAQKTETAKVIPLTNVKQKKSSFGWLRVAAILIVLLGAGFLAYQFAFNKKDSIDIAKVEEPQIATEKNNSKMNDSVADSDAANSANQNITTETTTEVTQLNKDQDKEKVVVTNGSNSTLTKESRSTASSPSLDNNVTTPVIDNNSKDARNDHAIDKIASAEEIVKTEKQEADSEARKIAAKRNATYNYNTRNAAPVANENKSRTTNDDYYRNMNTFRGRVTDANNNGVPFANVTNTEDNVGTYTDASGYFNLTSIDSALNVMVRSIGFDNRNMQLRNDNANNKVVLQEDRSITAQVISNKKVNSEKRQADNNMQLIEPEPEDGWSNYDSYLANNLNVPDDYKMKQNTGGEVEVSFEVNKYGEPVNFKVEKSLCSRCDEEAIRLIKEGPKWRRKAKKGRTTVTISF